MRKLSFLFAALVAGVSFVSSGEMVDPSAFEMKIEYVVSGYSGSTTITDLPVLVRLKDDAPSGFDYADCPQDSIRFADSEGNLLAHEVDTWNSSGESTIWVKIPQVSGKTTEFTMYFGGAGAKPAALDAKSVWSNYAAVFHGGAQSYANAVGNAIVGSAGSDKVTVQTAPCKVGGGINKSSCNYKPFNFTNPVKAGVLASVKNMTLSGWFCPDKYKNDSDTLGTGILMCSRSAWDDANNKNGFALMCEAGTWLSLSIGAAHNPSSMPASQPSFAWLKGQWNYYAFTYQTVDEDETYATYCNGAVCSAGTPANKLDESSSNDYWSFGGLANAAKVDNFRGNMDELRVFNGVASADYIAAEYATVGTDFVTAAGAKFVTPMPVTEYARRIDFSLSDSAKAALAGAGVQIVPVAVRLSSAIEGFSYLDFNADHTDILFGREQDGEIAGIYSYEIERWNPDGESVVWVRVPVDAEGTGFSIFYGKDKVYANDPTDVWSGYIGVWHMAENGGDNAIDATGHGLNGVPTGSKLTEMASDANAPVGFGRVNQTTAGKYNRLSVPNYNDYIANQSAFTVSGWFKSTDATGYPRPMSRKSNYNETTGWEIQYNQDSKTQCEMRGSSDKQVTMDGPDVTADWVHLSYVFNGTTGTAYANGGASKKSGTIVAVAKRNDPMAIGNNSNGSEQGWCGSYDEVRLYNGVQSDARVKSEYLAMTPGFLANDGVKLIDPEAPELGACTLTKVRDGEYRVDGVMAKNGAAVKLVFSAVGGEVVEKALGDQAEGVPFTTSITKADGLSDAYPYDVKIVVANDHGTQEKSLGVIGLWFPTAVNDFSKKFTVTVPETLTETLEGFPLLVRLSAANVEGFDYGDVQQNGADIVAADAAGNFLPCELQKYDPNGESLLWVRVPSMAAGTTITIYYGNPKPLIEIPSAKDTWGDYAGVWHLDETTAGTTALKDSTANSTDGTAHAKSLVAEGILGGARGRTDATGTNGAMATMPKNAALDALTPEFTVSGWLMPTTTSISWAYVFSRKNSDSYKSWGWQFRADGSLGSIGIYASGTSDSDSQRNVFSQSTIKQNVWTKYNVVYTSTKVSLYLDGKLVATQDIKPGAAVNGDLDFTLGGLNGSGHGTLKGYHDEVRLRRGAVGADWAAAEYAQEAGVFGTYGAAEAVDATAVKFAGRPSLSKIGEAFKVSVTAASDSGTGVLKAVYDAADEDEKSIAVSDAVEPDATYAATLTEMTADKSYRAGFFAVNDKETETRAYATDVLYNGTLTITKGADADEKELTKPGTIIVSRGDAYGPLTVNYTVGGTAVGGTHYRELPGSIVIPDGATSATIEIWPIRTKTDDHTVTITLAEGLYFIDDGAKSATIAVKKLVAPDGWNTWVADAPGLASVAENWSDGVPKAGDKILFDARYSTADCEWDGGVNGLTDSVAAWKQVEDFTGTVTIDTTYQEASSTFTRLTVNGDVNILGGKWTHPVNNTSTATYHLDVKVTGDFNLAAGTAIDCRYKGFTKGKKYPNSNLGQHGGSATALSQARDSVYFPKEIGNGGNVGSVSIGGGAVWLEIGGALTMSGDIDVHSWENTGGWGGDGSGAPGAVYISAKSVTGGGTIHAEAPKVDRRGTETASGGRVAIYLTEATELGISPVDNILYYGALSGDCAGAGTLFVKTAADTYGTLYVKNFKKNPGHTCGINYHKLTATTPILAGETWTFDRIVLSEEGSLCVPEGTTLVLPNGFKSVEGDSMFCGILYQGGNIVLGDGDAVHTIQNNWIFHANAPYTFDRSVVVKDGAAIGQLRFYNNMTILSQCNVTVNGDLTVEETGFLWARNTSMVNSGNFESDFASRPAGTYCHAGLVGAYALDVEGNTFGLANATYGSIFNPALGGTHGSGNDGANMNNGGGLLIFNVTGDLVLDGLCDASSGGYSYDGNAAKGSGGSVNITAKTLSGKGSITADGTRNSCSSEANVLAYFFPRTDSKTRGLATCTGGGRIAVKLTGANAVFTDEWKAKITAVGASRDNGNKAISKYSMASAGTVYLETAANGAKGGEILVRNDGCADNDLTVTPIPAMTQGDVASDFTHRASLTIGDCGRVLLNADLAKMSTLTMSADTKLDLNGKTLTVNTAKLGDTKLAPGTYAADAYPDYLIDSVGGGSLIVKGTGMMILVK